MNIDYDQSGPELFKPSAPGEDKKWYEADPAEGHRFLGEVLQLRIRREILKFIGLGIKTKGEIERTFGLNESVAEVHLALLEKAVIIEKVGNEYRSTPIGIAYLKNFEDFASEPSRDHTIGQIH
jgi:DNA-binding transcriptional ArsR family regulator